MATIDKAAPGQCRSDKGLDHLGCQEETDGTHSIGVVENLTKSLLVKVPESLGKPMKEDTVPRAIALVLA